VSYSIDPLETQLLRKSLRVTRRENDWVFDFGNDAQLHVAALWRFRSKTQILLTDLDDGQLFGLPAPVDAEARANEIVEAATTVSFDFDEATADLRVGLSNGVLLEIITSSGGYESWQAYAGGELLAVGGNEGLR
jgi:hypothetical protein